MTPSQFEGISWFDSLTARLGLACNEGGDAPLPCTDAERRNRLVTRARWMLLGLLSFYGLYAGLVFSFSKFGFFLNRSQLVFLFVSVAGVASYNLFFQTRYSRIRHLPFVDHLQIVLDILFITVLIHFSGGAGSWFWPVYLIATIEAAFLLPRQRDVWGVGAIGGALYGLLLVGHYLQLLPTPPMPFVAQNLQLDPLFLSLTWFWVAFLNTTVAIIVAYLMSVIRRDNLALQESEARLQDFVETANDLIFSVTAEGRFLYVNPLWQQTLGYTLKDLETICLQELVALENRTHCLLEFRKAVTGGKAAILEGSFIARDGRRVYVEGNIACNFEEGKPAVIWSICRDISQRKAAEEQLYHLAHYDSLTSLPNRTLLTDRLDQARALARRSGKQVAVLFLDLDRFKLINDTLGHAVGDQLLKAAAKRLKGAVREVDTVSRIGGDEFLITLVNIADVADIGPLAEKILKSLGKHFQIGTHELFVTTSIGISVFPDDGELPENLIKKADIAMYHAKSRGRNNYQFYNPKMDEDAERRLLLANSMRKALELEEFCVYYQPKIDIKSGQITAMEALVRWEHPTLGLLPPGEFIPLAEETGLNFPLGEWVLREACRQNVQWQKDGLPPLRMAVNLSGYQLQQPHFIDTLRKILQETGMEGQHLELEITETVVMQNPEFAVGILSEFRDLGIHISIDDFGTGYSSLAHLKRFSVNTLKIDKSFVRDVEINSTDAAIATAIIAMGSSLNLQVIAEGVETEGQMVFLRKNLCNEAQGYLFSKPLPLGEITRFLLAQKENGEAAQGTQASQAQG